MAREVLNVRKYKAGYEIRTEKLTGDDLGIEDMDEMIIKSAYTPDGDYIGNSKMANYLCKKRGIQPQKRSPSSNVCSVGFQEQEQKWYGWSHRAICGFGIGDKIYEERFTDDSSTPFIAHGDVAIANMRDARQAASNFAKSVS